MEAGIYRVNRVVNPEQVAIRPMRARETRNLSRRPTSTTRPARASTRCVDLHTARRPHARIRPVLEPPRPGRPAAAADHRDDQGAQESELVNSPEYGLLAQATPEQTIQTLGGAPTPDDLDALITKVWKTPSFFLTHPLGVAAFGREATYRGVPPPVVSLFGAQFITWRGIPLIPSDKVPVEDGKTKIILVRTGEERQGVVGLFQPGLVGEQAPGLSVRFTGINQSAIATYLVTLYNSLAVLTDDALAVLDDVAVDQFHEYK